MREHVIYSISNMSRQEPKLLNHLMELFRDTRDERRVADLVKVVKHYKFKEAQDILQTIMENRNE